MRKITTTLVFALLLSGSLMAQKKKWGHFGLKTGLNVSTLNYKDAPNGVDNEWKSGFVLGAFVKIPLAAKVSVQPEFLYSSMGGNFTDNLETTSLRINYFSIPVVLKYHLTSKFNLLAGPQIDALIQGKMNRQDKITTDLNEFSFGATAGFEFWPIKAIGFTGRYIHGFSNALNKDKFDEKWTNQGVQVTINFQLN